MPAVVVEYGSAGQPVRGIPWFEREDYDRVRKSMVDALPTDYDAWLDAAQTLEREAQNSGMLPVRAPIAASEFLGWCEGLRIEPSARARQAYANEVAYRVYLEQQPAPSRRDPIAARRRA